MAYVPNPNDVTQPTGAVAARTAAEEFRALKQKVNDLQGVAVTWNPADASSNIALSGGNLITSPAASLPSTGFAGVRSTFTRDIGGYFEVQFLGVGGAAVGLGTIRADLAINAGGESQSWGVLTGTGDIYHGGSVIGNIGGPLGPFSVLGIAFSSGGDLLIRSSYGDTLFSAGLGYLPDVAIYPMISQTYLSSEAVANFGATPFNFAIPTGYLPLYQQPYIYAENTNLVYNGAILLDQLNSGTLIVPVNNYAISDGWMFMESVAGSFQAQVNLHAATPPAGYANYQGVEVTLAYTPAAGEAFWIEHRVEGYNTVPLRFGKSTAAPLTLFFQVFSTLIGTHSGALTNGPNSRVFPFTFDIPVANVWTQIAITIPGDVAGTWTELTTNANLRLRFCLGAEATRKKAAGAWLADATNTVGVTGSVNIVEVQNTRFYYTGVELRRGIYAVTQPRELVTIDETIARCFRYFYRTNVAFVLTNYAGGAGNTFHHNFNTIFPMRVAPTISNTTSALVNCSATAIAAVGSSSYTITLTSTAGGNMSAQYDLGNTFDARM